MRTGLLLALGIFIHNFPEGMATFVGAMENINLGIAIAVAIAIHNIPEGLVVSVPIYAATGSRKKAFVWSFISGVSEPVGAGIAGLVNTHRGVPFMASYNRPETGQGGIPWELNQNLQFRIYRKRFVGTEKDSSVADIDGSAFPPFRKAAFEITERKT